MVIFNSAAIHAAMSDIRTWVILASLVLLAPTIAFPLATINGWHGTIDPNFLNGVAILTAGVAMSLLALLNVNVFNKFDAILENQTGHASNSSNLTADSDASDPEDENFVPGQCGKPGCRKMALTGARACREHVCNFCQVGWTSKFWRKKHACRPCFEKVWLVSAGALLAALMGAFTTISFQ